MPVPSDATESRPTLPPLPSREDVDALILPSVTQRGMEALRFLAVAQTIFGVAMLFVDEPLLAWRSLINTTRVLILFACVWALSRPGSRRSALAIVGLGVATQFVGGVAMSTVRQDLFPLVILVLALCSVASVYIPWGATVQAIMSLGAAATLTVGSLLVGQAVGNQIRFDAALTIGVLLIVTPFIAHSLDRVRRTLEQRLAEARQADLELANLREDLERRVADRTAELEVANRELEGFSYTVSHDLRSPLRAIAGFSQVILEDAGDHLDEETHRHLDKIRAAGHRMDRLIDDMLVLARVGRGALRVETVDLGELARSVGEDLKAEFPGHAVDLSIASLPRVQGDRHLLRIALDNLLRNAWKFTSTSPSARIRVVGETQNGRLLVRVTDDGVGFDPEYRVKLFQPFVRLHTDERFPGTGIGLATVARIIRRHGGDVDAEGQPNRGATFSFTLPTAAQNGQSTAQD